MTQNGVKPYALVSMPWFWAYLPSIQLAIVRDLLETHGKQADVFEFYTDLTALSGLHLYKAVANDSGYLGELLFSQFYFDDHNQQYNNDRDDLRFATREIQDDIFTFMTPVIEQFLEDCFDETNWGKYEAVCFSLTASQTSASMALAKKIKAAHPNIPIIFGGSSCAGDMGRAIAEMCREVDIVVHGEAENIMPNLVDALENGQGLEGIKGISWRHEDKITTNKRAPLHKLSKKRGTLKFDSYFERIKDNKILNAYGVWVPFESSRGCWYGEKAQCTFCGLNEIIQYRERGSFGLLDELKHYADKYSVDNFFAVDLIMPRSFYSDFLPEIVASQRDWTIFYEIKSNMKRHEVELLGKSGVTWIQPGIESLDDDILKIMVKGVSASHNIQTLKFSKQFGVTASWNLLTGFPRETAKSYFDMAKLLPKLHHLDPPVGLGDFEVHRFSPFFEKPEELGITLEGAFPVYKQIYPVADELLDRLVYRYAYALINPPDPQLNESRVVIKQAVDDWRESTARKAGFVFRRSTDGTAILKDSRLKGESVETKLDTDQAALLAYLDEMKVELTYLQDFESSNPKIFKKLGGEASIRKLVSEWDRKSIVLKLSGYVMALPILHNQFQEKEAKAETKRRVNHGRRQENIQQRTGANADA